MQTDKSRNPFYEAYYAAARRLDEEAMMWNDYGDSLALLTPPRDNSYELGCNPDGYPMADAAHAGVTDIEREWEADDA